MSRVAREVQAILAGAVQWLVTHRWRLAVTLAVAFGFTAVLLPRDAALLAAIQDSGVGSEELARFVTSLGRFENSTLAFAMIAAVVAMLANSVRWRDIAVACLLAGIVGGITVNVLRPTLGRARPHAVVAPGFYWFEITDDFNSMPSGHAMSNAASAFAIVALVPAAIVPATAYVVAMSWTRLRLNRHYPSDVMWGSLLGAIVGLAVGSSIRDRRRRAVSTVPGRS